MPTNQKLWSRYAEIRADNRTLRRIHQGRGVEGAIYAGLEALTGELPAHRPHNHWFDCVVGCAAAASTQGIERIGAAVEA